MQNVCPLYKAYLQYFKRGSILIEKLTRAPGVCCATIVRKLRQLFMQAAGSAYSRRNMHACPCYRMVGDKSWSPRVEAMLTFCQNQALLWCKAYRHSSMSSNLTVLYSSWSDAPFKNASRRKKPPREPEDERVLPAWVVVLPMAREERPMVRVKCNATRLARSPELPFAWHRSCTSQAVKSQLHE